MRERINLNDDWRFSVEYNKSMLDKNYNTDELQEVRLPHSVVETPFNYFDESIYQMVSAYIRKIYIPKEWEGKSLNLTFEGAAHRAEVFINSELVKVHENGYSAFTIDISNYVKFDLENTIFVKLDSNESLNQPPFGLVIDYMTYGGIYREVYLEVVDSCHIEDAFIYTNTNDYKNWNIVSEIKIKDTGSIENNNYRIEQKILQANEQGVLVSKFESEVDDIEKDAKIKIENSIAAISTWELENPWLYFSQYNLYQGERLLDSLTIRFGFRTAVFKKDGFYLNGKKIKIRGLNRHQSYPYVGYAMPANAQKEDAEIIKKELGLNAVRTSHYPQSQHFIDRCDEIGLLVFTEIPGWQYIGDENWQNIACRNTREMVEQYRNHPSIILWGVRINESEDNDEFYKKTNKIAHEIDPCRQTSGVRFITKSSLLEDVYSFNDFSHIGQNDGTLKKKGVTSDEDKPYLITEYNGHMYPTKSMDTERLRTEHAIRHANVVASYYKKNDIAGGFGWCMFDYNTHRDFGSGDRICYHGVMDAFRNPKLAAAVYASQKDAFGVGDVFAELTSSMDIGEYPGGNIDDIYAFTNAESVKLYKNNEFVKEFYPLGGKYNAMPHPPVCINDTVGNLMEQHEGFSSKKSETLKGVFKLIKKYGHSSMPIKFKLKMLLTMMRYSLSKSEGYRLYSTYIANWGGVVNTFRFDFILYGEVAKTIVIRPMSETRLVATAIRLELTEDRTYDATLVRFRMESENGRVLPFCNDIVKLEVSDNLKVMGPTEIPLRGGLGGAWIKTNKQREFTKTEEDGFLRLTSGIHEKVINFRIVQKH